MFSVFHGRRKDERERSMQEQLRVSIVQKNNCDREDVAGEARWILYTFCNLYTGWHVTGDTSGKTVILREKLNEKYRIKFFHTKFCFREK